MQCRMNSPRSHLSTSMTGQRDLSLLLSQMNPEIGKIYAFCVVDEAVFSNLPVRPLGFFQEAEGMTIILESAVATTLSLPYDYLGTLITLNVHSNLEAVGFLAAVTNCLAAEGISVNVISAVYHDHLFVRSDDAARTMKLLQDLSKRSI